MPLLLVAEEFLLPFIVYETDYDLTWFFFENDRGKEFYITLCCGVGHRLMMSQLVTIFLYLRKMKDLNEKATVVNENILFSH